MKKILLLLSGLIGLSAFTMSDNEDLKESIARGKVVYENNCVSCHMADGTGVGVGVGPGVGVGVGPGVGVGVGNGVGVGGMVTVNDVLAYDELDLTYSSFGP